MRKGMVFAALAVCLAALDARGEDHLVATATVQVRLEQASATRGRDLATLDAVFSTPRASAAAASLGVDVSEVRRGVATLSDAELRQLATRAAALRTDPPAGLSSDVNTLLVVFLIVAIVLLVLKAV